jgi:hypothetical protein
VLARLASGSYPKQCGKHMFVASTGVGHRRELPIAKFSSPFETMTTRQIAYIFVWKLLALITWKAPFGMETFGLTLQLPYLEPSSKRNGRQHYARKP